MDMLYNHLHAFLHNIRNYLHKVINIQRRKADLNKYYNTEGK